MDKKLTRVDNPFSIETEGQYAWDCKGAALQFFVKIGQDIERIYPFRTSAAWNEFGTICAWDGKLQDPTFRNSIVFHDGTHCYIKDGVLNPI